MRLAISLMWMAFIMFLFIHVERRIERYQSNKGIAVSNYLYTYLGVEVDPNEARYLHVNVNQYDVHVSDVEMFISNVESGAKKYSY